MICASAMNTPVLLAPVAQWTTIGPSTPNCVLVRCTCKKWIGQLLWKIIEKVLITFEIRTDGHWERFENSHWLAWKLTHEFLPCYWLKALKDYSNKNSIIQPVGWSQWTSQRFWEQHSTRASRCTRNAAVFETSSSKNLEVNVEKSLWKATALCEYMSYKTVHHGWRVHQIYKRLLLRSSIIWMLTWRSDILNSRSMYCGMLYSAIGSTTNWPTWTPCSEGQYSRRDWECSW